MVERRVDHERRKRVADMTPEEMRHALLVSEKTGLPNRRAFDEAEPSPWVAMCDCNGLKAMNDTYGYRAGDTLIQRLAEVLKEVGLDAYHNQGDEFIVRGEYFRTSTPISMKPNAASDQGPLWSTPCMIWWFRSTAPSSATALLHP